MAEAASEELPDIPLALRRLQGHPNAQCYLAYMLEYTIALVRPRRIWADAARRCIESIEYVNEHAMAQFAWRMKSEPFAYRIFTKILSDEAEMIACADCADLLDKFEKKFPK